MSSFSVKNVNQIFGTGTAEVHVLHDVNFEAEPGTLSSIMGPLDPVRVRFYQLLVAY